jgi:hypothetical protein
MPDRARVEQPGRELVEERLEGVVVVPVDEHDLSLRVVEFLSSADSGEATTEDENAWALGVRHSANGRPESMHDAVTREGLSPHVHVRRRLCARVRQEA